jgi:hypothetical protein
MKPPPPRVQYLLSLPERAIRSLVALSGGLLHEIGDVMLPASVRRTTLYRTMVDVALQFLIQEVGEVEGVYPGGKNLSENFILKRTASHGIELLGILTFRASPVWVLAALADATGGSRRLIAEISDELMKEGLLEERFETVEGMLDGLEKTSDRLAVALNLPPVDIPSLRREWEQLKVDMQSIPPKNVPAMEKIEGVWERLRRSSEEQGRSVFTVSSLMAVSAVAHVPGNVLWLSKAARSAARRTGKVLGEQVLDHYVETLGEITKTGFLAYWQREFRPYLRAAAAQFAPGKESLTERLLRRHK